ncbi:prepilin-type N-terminal cleavage/methylation domain-containing protein [bacterium]|nr:MAG: prepilin-type N-terminal cleavage/methylation domain-containing protein [bacterium]
MKKAFTLIELLVVIAIIAILAAILFPVFAQAKAAAKKTAQLSNFKQIATGVIMYMGDSDDLYPVKYQLNDDGSTPSDRQDWAPISWREETGPYIKNGVSQYNWIVNPSGGTVTGPWADKGIWESNIRPGIYGIIDMHQYLGTGVTTEAPTYPFKPISQTVLPRVANTVMMVEKGVSPAFNAPGRNLVVDWYGWYEPGTWPPKLQGDSKLPDGDGATWPLFEMPRYRQSGNSTTVTYTDGHAKSVVKGGINWCRDIHIDGMDPNQAWVFDAGNPCGGLER